MSATKGFAWERGWVDRVNWRPLGEKIGSTVASGAIRRAPWRTGALVKSIDYDYVLPRGQGVIARIWSTVDYSVYVELGTSRMLAQPYLRPALDDMRIVNRVR